MQNTFDRVDWIRASILGFNPFIKLATRQCMVGVGLRPQFLFLLTRERFDLYPFAGGERETPVPSSSQVDGVHARSDLTSFRRRHRRTDRRVNPRRSKGQRTSSLSLSLPFFSRALRRESKSREGFLAPRPFDLLQRIIRPADAFHVARFVAAAT